MAESTLYDELMTFDDLIATLTLSDDNRREMVRDYMADAIENTIHEAVLNTILQNERSAFAPEKYLTKLNDIIKKEQSIIDNLHSDIARLQCGKLPTYYLQHLGIDVGLLDDAEMRLKAAMEIVLHILLSGSIISYARKAQGALMSFVQSEANRHHYFSIYMNEPRELFDRLLQNGLIDSNTPYEHFQYFFAYAKGMKEPTEKIVWKGKTIELVCLIIYYSDNRPEWTVTERAFGISAKSLKASASRLKNSIGRKKRINDFVNKFLK